MAALLFNDKELMISDNCVKYSLFPVVNSDVKVDGVNAAANCKAGGAVGGNGLAIGVQLGDEISCERPPRKKELMLINVHPV